LNRCGRWADVREKLDIGSAEGVEIGDVGDVADAFDDIFDSTTSFEQDFHRVLQSRRVCSSMVSLTPQPLPTIPNFFSS